MQGGARSKATSLKLGFASDDDGFGYAIDIGLPPPKKGVPDPFKLDPEIIQEAMWAGQLLRPSASLVIREGAMLKPTVRQRPSRVASPTRTTMPQD